MSVLTQLREIGTSIVGRAVTETLYVSSTGSGGNGRTWASAHQTIQAALDAASTDGGNCTLIVVAPHATFYDINRTGDPAWSGNYVILGTFRNWPKIKNTHATATSILKFTGKVGLINLNFNLGTGSTNGVILTHGGFRCYTCQFVGHDLTGAATALHIDGASVIKHGKVIGCDVLGHATHMIGILVDNCGRSNFEELRIHDCLKGIQVIHADSDQNTFRDVDIGDCALALDIDAGNDQYFHTILLHNNTENIDDEVGDHIYSEILGQFPIAVYPDNLTGVSATAGAAGVYGADTEIRAAATATKPFRVVAVHFEPSAAEWYQVRFSADSGVTFYDVHQLNTSKRSGVAFPSGTEFIFNKGTRISCSARSESGANTVKVWVEVQEI